MNDTIRGMNPTEYLNLAKAQGAAITVLKRNRKSVDVHVALPLFNEPNGRQVRIPAHLIAVYLP